MNELDAASREAIVNRDHEIAQLKRLVFQSVPLGSRSLSQIGQKVLASIRTDKAKGFGGASDYEVWLRSLERPYLDRLIRLHTSVIDALRYRRRYLQHESERRFLHSSYGKHPAEAVINLPGDVP